MGREGKGNRLLMGEGVHTVLPSWNHGTGSLQVMMNGMLLESESEYER